MLIGITCDLRDEYLALGLSEEETAEFDGARTIEAVEAALIGLGHRVQRIGHVWNLTAALAEGQRWDMVFNFAEGLSGFGREAQIPALLEAYGIPYTFSDPLTLSLTLHKGLTKRVVRDAGLATPGFALVESPEDVAGVDLPYPLFAKPAAEGTGKGIAPVSKIVDRAALERVCRDLLRTFRQPVLVETFLPGREFTVGILGTGAKARVIGTMEIILGQKAEPEVYSYLNKELSEDRVAYRLVEDDEARRAAETALAAYRVLGVRDAGRVDLRSDAAGIPNFMEVNPLAGLHPEHSDLPMLCRMAGLEFQELIGAIMASASDRARTAVGLSFAPPVGRATRPVEAGLTLAEHSL